MTTIESGFSADAVFAALVFEDDFQRVVAQGLGGAWTWDSWDTSTNDPNVENAYVDGEAAVLPALNNSNYSENYESFSGFPFPSSGIAQFDFFVPTLSGQGNDQPVVGMLFNSSRFEPVDLYVWSNDNSGGWKIGSWNVWPWDPADFTPDPETWYTAQLRYTEDRSIVEYRVWKQGDPEPATPTVSGSFVGASFWGAGRSLPVLDLYYAAVDPELLKIDNVKVWTTANDTPGGVFSADAWLVSKGGAWTADAIRRRSMVKTGVRLPVATVVGGSEVASWSPTYSLSLNVPSGTQAGDTLLLTVWTDNFNDHHTVSVSPLPGWQPEVSTEFNNSGTYPVAMVMSRVVQAGDTATYTVNVSSAIGFGATLVSLRGMGGRSPVGMNVLSSDTGDYSKVPTVDMVSPVTGTVVAIFMSSTFGPSAYTLPDGLVLARESPSNYMQHAVGIGPATSGQSVQFTASISYPDGGSSFRASILLFWGGDGIALDAVIGNAAPSQLYNHDIVISLNDVPITDDVLLDEAQFLSQASGSPGTCTFKVKDPGKRYSFKMGDRLTLDIDGRRFWGGWIQTVKRGYFFPYTGAQQGITYQQMVNAPRLFIIEGVDYNILFRKRILYDKVHPEDAVLKSWPAGTSDSDMIAYLCANNLDLSSDDIDVSTMVQTVGSPNPDKRGNPAAGGWQWGDAMRAIARYPGAIYYIDPDRRLVYVDVDTPTSNWLLTDAPSGGWSIGYRDVEILHNGSNLRNDAMVWGVGQGSKSVKFKRTRDQASINTHGLWQVGDFRGDLWRQASVDKRSNSFVYGSPQNKRGGKDDAVSVQLTLFKPVLRVSEKIDFRSDVFGFSDVIPVRRSLITFPTPTQVKSQLTLSHEIDEPWNTFEFWFPPIPRPVIIIPGTKNAFCPVVNLPLTYTLETGEVLDLGRFEIIFADDMDRAATLYPNEGGQGYYETSPTSPSPAMANGGMKLVSGQEWRVHLAYPSSGDYQMLIGLDFADAPTSSALTVQPTTTSLFRIRSNGTVELYEAYSGYTPNNQLETRAMTSADPWYFEAGDKIYVRYCYFRGLYTAVKVWPQSKVEPDTWTLTIIPQHGWTGQAIGKPLITAGSPSGKFLVLTGMTIAASPQPALASAMSACFTGSNGILRATSGGWLHSWPFSAPGDDEYPVFFGAYGNSASQSTSPTYSAGAVWGYHDMGHQAPQNGTQQTASIEVMEKSVVEPKTVTIEGICNVSMGRSGGLMADRASYPTTHNVSVVFTVYQYAGTDELFWTEYNAVGRDAKTIMATVASETTTSFPFSIEVPFHEYASTQGYNNGPGYLRWGVSIHNAYDLLREMNPGGGPFLLPNTCSASVSVSGLKLLVSYDTIPGGDHFCVEGNGDPIVADERTCETYTLNEPQFGAWTVQLNNEFLPGSVSITVDGLMIKPGVDFTENEDRKSITYLRAISGVANLYICYVTKQRAALLPINGSQ